MAFTGNFTCNSFKSALLDAGVDFLTDTIKIALYTNAASLDQNTDTYTTDGEVVAAGYTAGGETLTSTVASSNGVSFVSFANVSWSGSFTARGALIYKNGGTAICVLDFGADRTSTGVFQVQFPAATADAALIRLS